MPEGWRELCTLLGASTSHIAMGCQVMLPRLQLVFKTSSAGEPWCGQLLLSADDRAGQSRCPSAATPCHASKGYGNAAALGNFAGCLSSAPGACEVPGNDMAWRGAPAASQVDIPLSPV